MENDDHNDDLNDDGNAAMAASNLHGAPVTNAVTARRK